MAYMENLIIIEQDPHTQKFHGFLYHDRHAGQPMPAYLERVARTEQGFASWEDGLEATRRIFKDLDCPMIEVPGFFVEDGAMSRNATYWSGRNQHVAQKTPASAS